MKKRHGLYAAILVCICLAALAAFRWSSVSASSEMISPHERANVPQGLWIWIDIHQKTLTLYEGTQVKKTYAIATGAWGTPTPIGTFRINSRFAGELGGFGTRFLGLNVPWGQFGIHGTNKPGSIGSNASHGCIRMFVGDSEELYGLVPNGTKVVIEGGPYGWLDTTLRPLQPGDRSSCVAALQARLLQLGYGYQWPDGIYGQATQAAVRKARKSLGLAEGIHADQALYRAIGLTLFE
ncbi:MAG: L,D-transpeptidase family protein [Clostridia bacterium]|nr:L,D-transpeptidase family protein [Clostridia bacterium]